MYIGTAGKKGNLTALRLRLFNRATAFALALVLLCTGLATIAQAATPTVDFQWTTLQGGSYVPDGDSKTPAPPTGYDSTWNDKYTAAVDVRLSHANNQPYGPGTIKFRIDPKQLQARDHTMTGYVFPWDGVPHKDSVSPGANPDFVYYYEGDVLVIENWRERDWNAHLHVPFSFQVAQYDASGNNKDFYDYVDGTSATYTVELNADGEIATDSITLTVDYEMDVSIAASGATVSKKKTEWVNDFADGWTWDVNKVYTTVSGNGVPAEFHELTFSFPAETLADYPGIRFMTMPVNTNLYNVTFSDGDPTNGYKAVTITCKEADGWCETIEGSASFKVHIPKSDYIGAVNASDAGTISPKYTVTTTAHPTEGPDSDKTISKTPTLTLEWKTPAAQDVKDNSFVTYVRQDGKKTAASKSKTNDENGEAQHRWDLTALHEGQDQYQRYTVTSEFDNSKSTATARLAGAIPTMEITASSSGNLNVGDTVTYTATLTNNETYDSRQIAFEIPFPADMTVNTANLQFTVNGAAYSMPATDYAWDSTNHILTIKKVPVISPGQTFTATILATATGPVHTTGFGVLELDQSSIELQNCGTATPCRMTVRNTGNATTPAGIPFEISFVAPQNIVFPNKAFESIKLNGTDITASVSTEFVGGSAVAYNGVAYLPALNQGDEITFTFKGGASNTQTGLQPQGPMMVRGKFGSLLLLPSAGKISPADSQPYATVGFMNKDVKENYQKRPFIFETIDTGLRFLDNYGSRTGTCDNSIGYTDSFYQCHLDSRDAQVKSVTIGKVKPEYVELTTHPDAKITLYGSPNVANSNPTWTKYAELTFKYSDTKPANTPTEGTGKGYYLTSVVHFNNAGEGATKADVQLPDGVLATRLVQENLRKVDWNVNTVLLANGPKVKARLDKFFEQNAIADTHTQISGTSYVDLYNDMFQFTYDPADAPTDGSIPSVDKFWKKQGSFNSIETSRQHDLPPFMRANGVTQGPVGAGDAVRAQASVRLNAEPQRKAQVGHTFTSGRFFGTGNVPYNPAGTDLYVIPNDLYMTSNLSNGYGSLCTLKNKLEKGEWKRIETVRFYSLQPYGARVRPETVRIGENLDSTPTTSEMKILDVQIEENWRNSGRQMLIVTVQSALKDINPTCGEGLDTDLGYSAVNNIDQARIRWDSEYTNIAYWTYGKSLERFDAAEAVVDGLPHDTLFIYDSTQPEGILNNATGREGKNDPVYWDQPQRNWMKNLTGNNSPQKFLYGSASYTLTQDLPAASDFQKTIAVGDSSSYSQKAWVNPSDEYTYQLAFLNSHDSSRKNIVIYDSLEQSDGANLPGDQLPANTNRFKGTMTGLSVGGLRGSLGIDPKVYVSTRDDLNLSAGSPDTDLTNTSIWTEVPEADLDTYNWSQVKTFAVDCSKKSNGDDFELPRHAGLIIEVFMKAPDDATTKTLLDGDDPSAAAYNESYAHCDQAADWDSTGAPLPDTAWDSTVVNSMVSNLNLHRSIFTPQVTKHLTGHALADDQFTFELRKSGSNDVIATATNKADGSVTFEPIELTAEDINNGGVTYTFKEVNDNKQGYTYDPDTESVTLTVVNVGDGQVTILGDATPPTFNNEYHASGAISVQGTKEVTGTNPPPLRAGQFTFTLYDNNGDEIGTTTNAANGDIVFNNITVTEANIGTHNFTVKETGDCPFEWVCDTSTKNVSVTVTDNDDGTLTATVSGGTPAFTFSNEYVPAPATGFFSGTLSGYVFLVVCALLGGVGAFWLRRKRRALLD